MIIDRTLSRPAQLFENIDQRNGIGLEIGALGNPAALPLVGKVYYADYCSTAQLRDNHRSNPTVSVDSFVEVDFVTGGGPLHAVVPMALRFDYVIASHVIEHVPDIISWLQDVGSVMKPGGVLSLIVPNKHCTFDVRRALSAQKDFFAAYIERRQKPAPIQVFDSYRWHDINGRLVHTLDYTIHMATKAIGEYVDCHCWVFDPESFHDEIEALCKDHFIPFTLDIVTRTPRGEIDMFARLIRSE
ncbi:methyltransferase domain-containing protein [Mesorhizobium sp. LjRoot246]|uniref:methyltransferase domain-containing protein n=1 Tax=Mesorhizobium sp. LjRoot246 TaxID=3342294 RepID=UPI003ECC517F